MTGPVIKYPGSKWKLAQWIISHMPPHVAYVEPFFGSGAVFFNKQPSRLEVINDLNGDVVHLFRMVREHPEDLARVVGMTPWSREEHDLAYQRTDDDLERARRFIVRTYQSISGGTNYRNGWRCELTDRRNQTCPAEWSKVPRLIRESALRLKEAQIENRPALDVIKRYSHETTLIYADPPYLLDTRNDKRYYRHEMTAEDHEELLEYLDRHPGPIILSGYASDLYDRRLSRWNRTTAKAISQSGAAREEVLWLNPVAVAGLKQLRLFEEA